MHLSANKFRVVIYSVNGCCSTALLSHQIVCLRLLLEKPLDMKMKIIAFGKFKSSQEYRQIFDYYKKRINFDIKLIELKSLLKPKKLEKEKDEIKKYINNVNNLLHKCVENIMKEEEDLSDVPDDGIREYLYEFCDTYYGIENEKDEFDEDKHDWSRVSPYL